MTSSRASTVVRIVLAVVGGYIAASALIALTAAALIWASVMTRSEAVILASLLGFIIYLVILLWGFAERSLVRLAVRLSLLVAAAYGLTVLANRYGV